MKYNMHAYAFLGIVVRIDVKIMVTIQTFSSQPPLGSQRPEMRSGGMNKFVRLILERRTR